MNKGQGDISQASVPEPRKMKLLGRNVNIKKLRLRERLHVSRIYFTCIRSLKGSSYVDLGGGIKVPKKIDLAAMDISRLIDAAPDFMGQIEAHYSEFLQMTTDLSPEEIEDLDVPDIFNIAAEVWDHNGFDRMLEVAAEKGKAAGFLEIASGSSEPSPSSRSAAVGRKTKS